MKSSLKSLFLKENSSAEAAESLLLKQLKVCCSCLAQELRACKALLEQE